MPEHRRRRATKPTSATPMRPEGSGGAGPSASLPLLDGAPHPTSSRRLASGPAASGTRPVRNIRTGSQCETGLGTSAGVIAGVAKDRAGDETPSASRRILESLLDGLGGGSDPKRTLLRFVEDLGRDTGSDRCGLLFRLPVDRDQEFTSTDLFWNAPGIKAFDGVRVPFRGNRVIEDLLARRETIVFQDCAADSRLDPYRDLCRELDLASLLLQPLVVRGETRGMLALHRCGAPRPFRPDDVERVRKVAIIAAVVIDHLLLWERERRRNSHLQILLEVQSRVARLGDLLELSRSAAETIHRAEPQFSVAVRLIDEAGGDLRSLAQVGSAGEGGREKEPPAGGGAAAALEAARTGRSRLVPDRASEPGCGWLDPGARAALHVPIPSKEETVGVLTIETPHRGAFGDDDVATFQAVAAILGVAIDNAGLFERVEREKEDWAKTFDAITDMVSIHDQDFRLLRCNQALLARVGLPAYELTGHVCSEVYARVVGASVDCPHPEAERGRRPVSREIDGPGGGVFRITALPCFESASCVYSVHICEDITEEKRLREQLLQSEKMSAVGQLVAGVAHELNNPLAGVMGYTQLLMTRPIDAKVRDGLERVFSEAQRAAKIVQNLLTFARKHRPEKRSLGLNGIVEKTLELRAYELRVSNIEVTTDLAPDLPKTMLDFHQMQQVILNIVTNAEQAMLEARGRGLLRVGTRARGDRIELRIQDDGPGVAPQHLPRLFDPFFTTKPAGKGTGLGLSICDGIVKEHGGRLRVESAPGQGATFIVDLPIVSEEASHATPEAVPVASLEARGRSILVVDDEPSIQDLLVEILTREGFRVDTVGSGAGALVKIEKRPYDLIISDLKMPGMSGRELYDRILERTPRLARRVLFTSGETISPGTDEFLRRAESAALLKPFTIDDLRAAVERFFRTN